jgi:hypothetical protein
MERGELVARHLASAVGELERREVWRRDTGVVPPFLIDLEGEEHPIFAMFLNAGSGGSGLMLLRGERAVEELEELVVSGNPDLGGLESSTALHVHVSELREVPANLRGLVHAAGIEAKRGARVPVAVAKPPRRGLRSATGEEMGILLECIEGILAADEGGQFAPERIEERGDETLELTIRVSGCDDAEPSVEDDPDATPFDGPDEPDELWWDWTRNAPRPS